MWDFIGRILSSFRKCLSRQTAFYRFCILAIGFIIYSDQLGVASVIRNPDLNPSCHEPMVRFFRSSAFALQGLAMHWYSVIKKTGCCIPI